MRPYLKPLKRLIQRRFPAFGRNKKQEIIRLVYEICRREDITPADVLGNMRGDFGQVKARLIQRRYPLACAETNTPLAPYLPTLGPDPRKAFRAKGEKRFYPRRIFVETAVSRCRIAANVRNAFPQAKLSEIKSIREYRKTQRQADIISYNCRRKTLFLIRRKSGFFRACPCTKGAAGCGYHIFNLAFGCIFECSYCYLQEYIDTPGIILAANIDEPLAAFAGYEKSYGRAGKRQFRIGTGEFSDSLMLDEITEYSLPIIRFFAKRKNATFEFKTKSQNIANLLKAEHGGNIIVSWSLNPPGIIGENEFFTASLSQRLKAAQRCVRAGYKVGFHFDPIFYFAGWEKEYGRLTDRLFATVKAKHIAWISLGTLRFRPRLKKIIEARFPQNRILNEELLIGYDGKLRYPDKIRRKIYDFMGQKIKSRSRRIFLYLCMERPLYFTF
ncbi:MAG: radical SAM protein [Candidatus Omnitrophota bacterium]